MYEMNATFDVGSVVVLIGHDHDFAVAQIPDVIDVFVLLRIVQSDDFAQIGNFRVLHHLRI